MDERPVPQTVLIPSDDQAAIIKMCELIARLYSIRREFETLEGVEPACITSFSNAIGDSIGSCTEAITGRIQHLTMIP